MASAEFTVRKRGGSASCSIQSEQDLVIQDEANFSAAQTLKEYEQELLDLVDPERVRVYLYEKNLLKVNENKTLKDGTKNKKEKMKYVLNETNCIKGTRGLQHVLGLLQSLGNPAHTELANRINTDYYKRMESIHQQYPYELQSVRFRSHHQPEHQQQPAVAMVTTQQVKLMIMGRGYHNV